MAQTVKSITCTCCPFGCAVEVILEGKQIIDVKGYTCRRGLEYAEQECVCPKRTLTSVVKVKDRPYMLSVKTASAIPFELFDKAVGELSEFAATAPVRVGDVLIVNVAGSGVDVVATKEIL